MWSYVNSARNLVSLSAVATCGVKTISARIPLPYICKDGGGSMTPLSSIRVFALNFNSQLNANTLIPLRLPPPFYPPLVEDTHTPTFLFTKNIFFSKTLNTKTQNLKKQFLSFYYHHNLKYKFNFLIRANPRNQCHPRSIVLSYKQLQTK